MRLIMNQPSPEPRGVDPLLALVADDDGATRRLLTMVLERQGYRVLVAVDGVGALQHFRESGPGVVFLDARMPAPDGYEVCRTIRSETATDTGPYVTMLTASGRDDDRQRATEAGVDEFLTKPFSPSRLSARLSALAQQSAG